MYETNQTDSPLLPPEYQYRTQADQDPPTYSSGSSTYNGRKSHQIHSYQEPIIVPDGDYTSRLTPPASKRFDRARDILLVLPAFIFLIFAALCNSLHNKEVDKYPYGLFLLQAAKVGPTLFPILFAMVMGETTRILARLILERGGKLGVIEQLHSSNTLGGTLSTVFTLRSWTIVSFLLVLVWGLSPLGGQASLRILQTTVAGTSAATDVYYMLGNSTSSYLGPNSDVKLHYTSIFRNSILATKVDRNKSMDTSGNVRVPFLQSLDGFSGDWTNSSWVKVSGSLDDYLYSSLVGVPIVGLTTQDGRADHKAKETHFRMETDYIHLTCPTITPTADYWTGDSDGHVGGLCSTNTSKPVRRGHSNHYFFGYQSAYITSVSSFNRSIILNPYTLNFYIRYSSPDSKYEASIKCTLYQRFVESEVTCKERNCAITSIRPSPIFHDIRKDRYDQIVCQQSWTFGIYLYEFAEAVSGSEVKELVPLWLPYLMNHDNPFQWSTGVHYPDLGTLSPKIVELRMSQLLNTFWKAGIGTEHLFGNAPTVHQLETDPSFIANNSKSDFRYAKVLGKATTYREVYVCEIGWLVALILGSLAMVIAGVIKITLGFTLYTPDILGYVSSLMRDNMWSIREDGAGLTGVGSTLDGDKRSRLLKEKRLRLRNVREAESDSIGYIGLIWEDEIKEKESNGENRGLDIKKQYL